MQRAHALHKAITKSQHACRAKRTMTAFAVIVLVAASGTFLTFISHAATPVASVEAETGTLAGGAATVSDPSASGGESVAFNGTSSSTDGCSVNSTVAPCMNGTASGTGASGWGAPSFDDEFNGSNLDTTTWNTENGWAKNGVTVSASNETVSGGDLILTLASSSSGAEISTNSYNLPVGGFAEARIDFPGNGTSIYNWPAWWVSGPNWPQAGEADIFEGLGSATTNYHYYSGGDQQSGPFYISGTWSNAFHTYGVYRGEGYNDIYWDGQLVKTYSTDDNGQAESLILTNGCSGGCTPGAQVKVDYVRAWQ